MEGHLAFEPPLGLDADDDLAPLGELDGVADEVDDHLAEPGGVAHQEVRDLGRDVAGQLEPLLVRPDPERLERVAQAVAQAELDPVELLLAGLDLGEVEDVVDDRQEGRRPSP